MAKKQDRDLIEEAKKYVASLPDESAEGRLTSDTGRPADAAAWQDEETEQRATLKPPYPDDDH
jgi:hypothetical protein